MKIVVIDTGLYSTLAEPLSDGGKNKVLYWTPWARPFPTSDDLAKGYGYGDLKKVTWLFKELKDADMIVNFDISQNDLIAFLRELWPEKSIFGAGEGERLEHDRVFLKQWLEHYNLPVGPYKVIKGMTALSAYLKNNTDKYIKTNIYREEMESLFFTNWKDCHQLLDEKTVQLGMLAEDYTFIVEDPIDCVVELGSDGFFGDGYVPFSWGAEIDKNLYIGKVIQDIEDLPPALCNTMETISPLLDRMNYRGAISTEERCVTKNKSYFIDMCARVPAPMGQMYPVMIHNWAELIYKIGKKEKVEVECDHDYIGAYAISSEHAATHNLKIMIDEKHLKDVRLQMAAQNKDGLFACKGNTSVCVLAAGGSSPKEVLDKIKDAKKYVDAYGLETEGVDGIEEQFNNSIKGLKSLGIKF